MRLWHYKLIPFLPRQQLLGQWRECCSIAVNIATKGTPRHILVNRIMNYPKDHFYSFCRLIQDQMLERGYKVSSASCSKIWTECWSWIDKNKLFQKWHNDVYLRQCLYNLEEKYICNGMSQDEWDVIYSAFKDFTPLVKERNRNR